MPIFGKSNETLEKLKGIFTATEINQQPATWRKTIAQIESQKEELKAFIENVTKHDDYDIILTGAGTSEFVGNTLYSYINKATNFKAKSFGTTDLVATPENYLSQTKPTLLISFGRSGNSPESIGAVDVADEVCGSNLFHLFVTCNRDGALSKAAETRDNAYAINLTDETHDQSFAMTSSFSNMMLATLLCFSLDTLDQVKSEFDDIIRSAEDFLERSWLMCQEVVGDYFFDRIVYLGANALKGIAQESALKMLELTAGQTCTMFDTPLGFRHGPKSIINNQTLTVVYISDDEYARNFEIDLIKEMVGQRKRNQIIAITAQTCEELEDIADYTLTFNNKVPHDNVFLAFEYILFAQTLALFKSLAYDITPDNPCPTGEVNRVVQGVTLYPYTKA